MQCLLCSHDQTHKHGQTSKGSPRGYCPNCRKTFIETFETLYSRRKTTRKKIEMVLQAHSPRYQNKWAKVWKQTTNRSNSEVSCKLFQLDLDS